MNLFSSLHKISIVKAKIQSKAADMSNAEVYYRSDEVLSKLSFLEQQNKLRH